MLGRLYYKTRLRSYHYSKTIKTALHLGRLPDFLIVGTQKGGTTTLFELLRLHPAVKLPFVKESHFFSEDFHLGPHYYRSCFPMQLPFLKNKPTGESTPQYLFHQATPERVKALVPNAKIILLLRNPVRRAFSHYKHNLRKKREPLSFPEAIKAEEQRTSLSDNNLKHYSYVKRGIYLPQLKRWMEHFDRKNILILSSEDFFSDTEANWKTILSFLNLPYSPLASTKIFNKTTIDQQMDESVKEQLFTFFQPHNEALFNFLGQEYDWTK